MFDASLCGNQKRDVRGVSKPHLGSNDGWKREMTCFFGLFHELVHAPLQLVRSIR